MGSSPSPQFSSSPSEVLMLEPRLKPVDKQA